MGHTNWITSDTHFGHENIIKYCNRPFKSVVHMNEELIKKWNNTVKENDTVFHLGDFGFGNKNEIEKIVSRLNGDIVLLLGNHDLRKSKKLKFWYECGFHEVYGYSFIYKNTNVIMSHKPLKSVPDGFVNIHGHMHDKVLESVDYVNACVECCDYKPINLDKLIAKLKD